MRLEANTKSLEKFYAIDCILSVKSIVLLAIPLPLPTVKMKKKKILILLLLAFAGPAFAQQKPVDSAAYPPPVAFTAQQDHDDMMKQLGIKTLRPGPSGDDKAPNHANYDEALANPYPDLPDALTLKNGRKVTTADMWWKQRRPEIVEDFEREVYGRVPAGA